MGCSHGSGTGGTIEGIRRYVSRNSLPTKVCMVKPSDSPHGIQGIADGKEFLAKESDMDSIIEVSTDEAIEDLKTEKRVWTLGWYLCRCKHCCLRKMDKRKQTIWSSSNNVM